MLTGKVLITFMGEAIFPAGQAMVEIELREVSSSFNAMFSSPVSLVL